MLRIKDQPQVGIAFLKRNIIRVDGKRLGTPEYPIVSFWIWVKIISKKNFIARISVKMIYILKEIIYIWYLAY